MQISSEQAFDMLPYVVDMYDKLGLTDYIKKVGKENKAKGLNKFEAAEKAIKYIVKNSSKCKEEFFGIVAVAENKKLEEVKAQPFIQTLNTFKAIYKDKDLVGFFKSAIE